MPPATTYFLGKNPNIIGLRLFYFRARPHTNYQLGLKYFCGDYLLSREKPTIIGLELFHFCVRNGNRWDKLSIIATEIYNWCGGEVWKRVEPI